MSAMQASIMPQTVSSPTLATPRPSSLSLRPSSSPAHAPSDNETSRDANAPPAGAAGDQPDDDQEEDERESGISGSSSIIDGRNTPTASSTSSNVPSPNPTTISLLSQTTQSTNPPPTFAANISHPAEVGLGNLGAEEQLKAALQSKDRMFLLVLAKEFEAFISRSSAPSLALVSQAASSSTMPALSDSVNIGVTPTSKFQRMLVYKTAEWYGLKAVSGQDGQMVVGVLGSLGDRSAQLRLSELVPAAPSPTQKFRIMQRAPPQSGNSSDRSSPAEGMNGEGRAPKWKSLEEREAAYAAAREKIYGKAAEADGQEGKVGDELDSQGAGSSRAGQAADEQDDIDPVPRRLYANGAGGSGSTSGSGVGAPFEVVFPSLYHPPKAEPHAPPPNPPQTQTINQTNQIQYQPQGPPTNYAYQSSYNPYAQQVDVNGYPLMPGYPHQPPPQANYGVMPQGYVDAAQGYVLSTQGGYAAQSWQQGAQSYPGQVLPPNPNQQPYMVNPSQQNGAGQVWQYPPHQVPQMMTNGQQAMPMIPQGYPTSYGYPQQAPPPPPIPQQRQGMYPQLVQPTPMRPQIHPHSSASSSISSRSYQDGSRPHSRGSNTSTRSAASSVRLGAMYPATQGPGYRQKAMKGPGMNGLTSLGLGTESKARTRGHSPSSTTTTSSRSSRRANSIQLAPPTPGQHQLPQRPDWAANNVPYHPSPMPVPGSIAPSGPNAAEFPPLLRQGQGTNAEPMQVERAKMKPVNGGVWNGAAVKNIQHGGVNGIPSPVSPRITILPGPSRTPGPGPTPASIPVQQALDSDPDFPRRIPAKSAPSLYDPSAPRTASLAAAAAVTAAVPIPAGTGPSLRPPSVINAVNAGPAPMSAEDIIEAKLAAVSINAGVSIGPPPARGGGASYAKIVRRD